MEALARSKLSFLTSQRLFVAVFVLGITLGNGAHAVEDAAQVAVNHPPRFLRALPYTDPTSAIRLLPGETIEFPVPATDPDGDAIVYGTRNLPKRAQFDPENQTFEWTPEDTDVGLHSVIFTATDGLKSDALLVQFLVRPKRPPLHERQAPSDSSASEVDFYFQPGIGYSLYVPGDQSTFGVFQGVQLELNIASWIHKNENRGPSHGRFYVKAEILPSTRPDVSQLFLYSLGTTLTFERNPKRNWLLPLFGFELGGLNQDEMGSAFQSSVFGGVHLWASPNLFVNLTAGYLLVPKQMKALAGFHGGVSVDFSLW